MKLTKAERLKKTLEALEQIKQEENAKPKPERKKRGKDHESPKTDWKEALKFFGK